MKIKCWVKYGAEHIEEHNMAYQFNFCVSIAISSSLPSFSISRQHLIHLIPHLHHSSSPLHSTLLVSSQHMKVSIKYRSE